MKQKKMKQLLKYQINYKELVKLLKHTILAKHRVEKHQKKNKV